MRTGARKRISGQAEYWRAMEKYQKSMNLGIFGRHPSKITWKMIKFSRCNELTITLDIL